MIRESPRRSGNYDRSIFDVDVHPSRTAPWIPLNRGFMREFTSGFVRFFSHRQFVDRSRFKRERTWDSSLEVNRAATSEIAVNR
jgi:hypothetical protein